MARTIPEIYNSIIAEKQNFSQLSNLAPSNDDFDSLVNNITNKSNVAIWRVIFYVAAVGIWVHEKLFDKHKQEVQAIVESSEPPTVAWYRKEIFKFQYDTSSNTAIPLQIINGRPQYTSIDPALQIIARCSIVEDGNGQAIIKVVKDDGGIKPLTTNEVSALDSYVADKGAMGIQYSLVSLNADQLLVNAFVYYDPQVDPNVVQSSVEQAINDYLANLDFDGSIFYQKVVDAIQSGDGVVDVTVSSMSAKDAGGSYGPFGRKYQTVAGWIESDNLSNTISYIASV